MGKIANTNITIANPLPNTGNQSRSSSASSQGNISLIDPKKQALMDKFHISLEQCNALLEKHPEIIGLDNEQELNEIVSNFLNPKPKTKYKAFDPKEYNNSTVDQKKQTGDYEFARNIYIYGFKGDDKYVRTIPAHSVEAWEQLPDSEKADFISKVVNKVKSIRDNDKNLKEIFINLENGDRKLTDENIVDIGVEALQVANANNMSIQDFMKLKPTQRIDLIYTYLGKQSAENLSNSQFDTLKFFRAMKENIKNYLKDNFGEELTDDVSMSEVFQIAGDYNLSKEKVQFDILANKVNRTSEEEEQYQRLKDIFETPAGQDIVDKTQATKLLKLQKTYNELVKLKQSGQKLSPEQEAQLKRLEYTMQTDESKRLFEVAKHIPSPETDAEKQIMGEWDSFNDNISPHVANNPKLKIELQIAWLDKKLESLPESEREAYLVNILKFNNDPSTVQLLLHYKKDFPTLLDEKFLISENSLITADMDNNEFKRFADAKINSVAEAKRNGDEFTLGTIYNASITTNEILKSSRCSGPEHDSKKVINASTNSELAEHYDTQKATEILNSTTDVNTTITDADSQLEAQQYIQNSNAYNEDVAKHEIDVLNQFHEDNRETIRNTATSYSSNVADYAAQKDSGSTNNNSTSVNDFAASLNKIQNSSSQVIPQEVENIVKNLDLSNPDDAKKFADIVDKYSNQISNYLAGCSLKQKEDFIEKFCSVASRSQIMAFLKNNPSLYNIVLKYSHGLNNEEVFRILMSDERNKSKINDIMESLTLNPIDVARNNKEFAVDIALLGDNKDLALDILKNPNIYGYSLGDRYTTVKLNRVASEGNYPPRTQNNKPFLEKA